MPDDKEVKAIYELSVKSFNLRQRLVDKVVAALISAMPELHNDTEIRDILKKMREVQIQLEVMQSIIDKKGKENEG